MMNKPSNIFNLEGLLIFNKKKGGTAISASRHRGQYNEERMPA